MPEDGSKITIDEAVREFLRYTKDGGARDSTLEKYMTLTDQLEAFCESNGYRYIQQLDRDAVLKFRRSWEDPKAGYKKLKLRKNGDPLWTKVSPGTAKRNAKTLRYLFNRCIQMKWVPDNPTATLQFPKDQTQKKRRDVKYVTEEELATILACVDAFKKMPKYNKLRLKALILLMRWSGLRSGDAVLVTTENIKGDVLFLETKKASTPVQIPLPEVLMALLNAMQPYSGGYFFWNRRKEEADTRTVHHNFCVAIAKVFRSAGVKTSEHHVSHMLRNSFAVDLLEKGVSLETVSLLLSHQSVSTTERYYADFSQGYMDKAEARVRETWALHKA